MRQRLDAIALGLFLVSLVLPALVVEQRPLFGGGSHVESMFGFHCLALGVFFWPGWVANPLLVIAWGIGAVARGRAGYLAVATVVTVLALASAVFAAFLVASLDRPRLITIHVGYYVWLASIVITLLDLSARPRRPELTVPPAQDAVERAPGQASDQDRPHPDRSTAP